ncbi:MAG: hypothetical protein ACRYE7_02365 [Janthinobacterium lividum]
MVFRGCFGLFIQQVRLQIYGRSSDCMTFDKTKNRHVHYERTVGYLVRGIHPKQRMNTACWKPNIGTPQTRENRIIYHNIHKQLTHHRCLWNSGSNVRQRENKF